jgi:hypothetical protein
MFDPNDTITEYVEALFAACAPLQRREILTHEAIIAILKVRPHEEHWPTCIAKLKRRMESARGITLWPEVGVGYRLLTEAETLTMLPKARLRRANRHIARALRSINSLPDSALGAHLRRLKAGQLDQLRLARRSALAAARRAAVLSKPIEARPKPTPA